MKTLYFLRHGIAADRTTWQGTDDDRPLTETGRCRVRMMAQALVRVEAQIGQIRTSPSLRAQQTAQIVAERLHLTKRLVVEPLLTHGFDCPALEQILVARSTPEALLLVGHEPDFSLAISSLIGGGRIALKKAGLARVDIDPEHPLKGVLIWLLSPKLMRHGD